MYFCTATNMEQFTSNYIMISDIILDVMQVKYQKKKILSTLAYLSVILLTMLKY